MAVKKKRRHRTRKRSSPRRIIRLINNAIRTDAKKKGRGAEQRVYALATKLACTKQLPVRPEDIHLTEPRSKEDLQGWDLIINTDKGDIPIQIKSSYYGRRRFLEKYPNIPCIVAQRRTEDADLQARILCIVEEKYAEL